MCRWMQTSRVRFEILLNLQKTDIELNYKLMIVCLEIVEEDELAIYVPRSQLYASFKIHLLLNDAI